MCKIELETIDKIGLCLIISFLLFLIIGFILMFSIENKMIGGVIAITGIVLLVIYLFFAYYYIFIKNEENEIKKEEKIIITNV